MKNEYRIPVYNEDGDIVGRVQYNENLDYWDGHNMSSGSTGRHLGITQLKKSRNFVLIYGTQWQGERDYAQIATIEEAVKEVLRTGHDEILTEYPELQEYVDNLDSDELEVL